MNLSQLSAVSSQIVPDITAVSRTDKLCLILFKRQSFPTKITPHRQLGRHPPAEHSEPTFLYQTGIHCDHLQAYRSKLFQSDPHIQKSFHLLARNQSHGDWIHLETSKSSEKILYNQYLLKAGIYQTATYTRRITRNSYLVAGMLSNQRRNRIRLEESLNYLSDWLDAYCDVLLESGLQSQALAAKCQVDSRSSMVRLTPRERDVLLVLRRGFSNKQIASELNLSENTVENHLRNIYKKFNVHNRTTLLAHTSQYC